MDNNHTKFIANDIYNYAKKNNEVFFNISTGTVLTPDSYIKLIREYHVDPYDYIPFGKKELKIKMKALIRNCFAVINELDKDGV